MLNLFSASILNTTTSTVSADAMIEQIIGIITKYATNEQPITAATNLSTICDDEGYAALIEELCITFRIEELDTSNMDTVDDLINAISNLATVMPTEVGENSEVWDSVAFATIAEQASIMRQYVDSLKGSSDEGLGGNLFNMFISTANLFCRVGNVFKTNLFRFYKPFKRSELRKFIDDNSASIYTLRMLDITSIAARPMYIPTGMTVGYPVVVQQLGAAYVNMNAVANADAFVKALVDIRRLMTREDMGYKTRLVPLTHHTANSQKALKSASLKESFSSTNDKPVSFDAAYQTVEDFRAINGVLLGLEHWLSDTSKLLMIIDNADVVLSDITSYLTSDTEIDAQFVSNLAAIVEYHAKLYDTFGINVVHQMTVEHNHIINLKSAIEIVRGAL